MVGILAFKVRRQLQYTIFLLCFTLLIVTCDCCIAIGCSASGGCGALLARARVERRDCVATVGPACAARRHPVVRVALLAVINTTQGLRGIV